MHVISMAVGEKNGDHVEVEGGYGLEERGGVRAGVKDGRIAILLVPENVGIDRHVTVGRGGRDQRKRAGDLRPVITAGQPDEGLSIELEHGGEGAGRRFVELAGEEAVDRRFAQAGRFCGGGGGEIFSAQGFAENVGEVVFQRDHSCCDFNCWRRTK